MNDRNDEWNEIRRLQSALRTEQEMHNAWRKRAEEAEAELHRVRSQADGKV